MKQGWIKQAAAVAGCERIEAFLTGQAYDKHRHDTYAIGRTLAGVQQFSYRGEIATGLPGTVMVLHPDELHDGQAGTEAGFHYRMIYIEPSLIQRAIGGRPLPFIQGGVSNDPQLLRAVDTLLGAARVGLQHDDALYDLAQALDSASPTATRLIDYRAAERADGSERFVGLTRPHGKPFAADHRPLSDTRP